MRFKQVATTIVLTLGFFSCSTRAQVVATWTGTNGSWSNAANWSTNPSVPVNDTSSGYSVYISGLSVDSPTVTFDLGVGSITSLQTDFGAVLQDNGRAPILNVVGSSTNFGSAPVTNYGTINWRTGVLNVTGDYYQTHFGQGFTTIGDAAVLNVGGQFTSAQAGLFTVSQGGVTNVGGNFLNGDGTVGTIGGTLQVGGSYQNGFAATTTVSGLLGIGGNVLNGYTFDISNRGIVSVDGNFMNTPEMSPSTLDIRGALNVAGLFTNDQGDVTVRSGGILKSGSYVQSSLGGGNSSTEVAGTLLTSSYQQTGGDTTIDKGGIISANTFTATSGMVTVNGTVDPAAVEIGPDATLQGSGMIIGNLAMGGTMSGGDTLTVLGNYQQIGSGTLDALMSPVSRVLLDIHGDAALGCGSLLDLVLTDGYDPLGHTFVIMRYDSLVGRFANGGSFWDDGYLWDITYGQNEIDVTAVRTPEPRPLLMLGMGLMAIVLFKWLGHR